MYYHQLHRHLKRSLGPIASNGCER